VWRACLAVVALLHNSGGSSITPPHACFHAQQWHGQRTRHTRARNTDTHITCAPVGLLLPHLSRIQRALSRPPHGTQPLW
jgi:hypothetical protein